MAGPPALSKLHLGVLGLLDGAGCGHPVGPPTSLGPGRRRPFHHQVFSPLRCCDVAAPSPPIQPDPALADRAHPGRAHRDREEGGSLAPGQRWPAAGLPCGAWTHHSAAGRLRSGDSARSPGAILCGRCADRRCRSGGATGRPNRWGATWLRVSLETRRPAGTNHLGEAGV